MYLEMVKAEDKKVRSGQGTKRCADNSYKMKGMEAFLEEDELIARKQSKGGPEWVGSPTGLRTLRVKRGNSGLNGRLNPERDLLWNPFHPQIKE